MRGQRYFIRLTLFISILFGIILPLALGVKDSTYIAISFSSVWFLYIVKRRIALILRPSLKIKVHQHKNPTIIRFEIKD